MTDDIFTYTDFILSDDRQTVHFNYEISHEGQRHSLSESLTFPVPLTDTPAQAASLRALHLALGVSYYKIFVPETIVQPYAMEQAEADFWNDIWRNGLGEFMYVNQISADRLATFSAQAGETYELSPESNSAGSGALLGIGGGKDSIVAGELLKAVDVSVEGFVMATGEQRGQAQAVADTMDVPLHVVNRVLDKQLLNLQEQPGAYKGHIPISLIFGLVGTALAIASNKQYVIVANEASASTPRISGPNGEVNHQWSKSFGFEKTLQAFVLQHISPSVTYFSAVRQLTSVGVAKLFTQHPAYFEVFTSDNFVFRIDPTKRPNARWSLESPKSLSSFILLAPWLTEADMLRIFGLNFLDEPTLQSLFLALIGLEGESPLDCVGTVDELVLSLRLAHSQTKFSESFLVKLAADNDIFDDTDLLSALTRELQLQSEHVIPAQLSEALNVQLSKDLENE